VSQRTAAWIVVVATLGFAAALALTETTNGWVTTGLAAAGASLLAGTFYGEALRGALRPGAAAIASGVGSGLLLAVLTHMAYEVLAPLAPVLVAEVEALYLRPQDPPGPVLALPILVLVVAAEELIWRGVLVDLLLARGWGPGAVVVASAAAYAVPQLGAGSWLLPLVAFGLGLIWGVQRVMTGTITVPLLTHLVWSAAIFVAAPLTSW
jgi:uncharacterized protein